MYCEFCGKEEPLPFVCNYCGGAFCPDHRLPEAHQCKGNLSQKRTITPPPQTTFSWQVPSTPEPYIRPRSQTVFSRIEVRDILIAWLALGVAFASALGGGALNLIFSLNGSADSIYAVLTLFFVSLVTAGSGFVLHEMSHKFVAQGYGYWAEFRMWPQGLILALITSIVGFIIAAPGATYISGENISKEQNGWISLVGPLTNLAVSAVFYFLYFNSGLLGLIGYVGVRVNVLLAAFNLIPFGPLDGSKVFKWNPILWGAIFVPIVIAFIYSSYLAVPNF